MGFVSVLERKQANAEMVAFIRDTMIPAYSRYFGLPAWLEKPKTDQCPEEIIRQYAIKLELYEQKAILDKGEALFRDKSLRTFPTPEQIKALLSAYDLKIQENKQPAGAYINLESQYMVSNKNSNLYNHCLLNDYTRAIKYIINELLPEKIGQSEYARVKRQGYSELVNLAQRNGLFADFNTILLEIYNQYHHIRRQESLPL